MEVVLFELTTGGYIGRPKLSMEHFVVLRFFFSLHSVYILAAIDPSIADSDGRLTFNIDIQRVYASCQFRCLHLMLGSDEVSGR